MDCQKNPITMTAAAGGSVPQRRARGEGGAQLRKYVGRGVIRLVREHGLLLLATALTPALLFLVAHAHQAGWIVHGVQPPSLGVAAWAALFLAGWTLMTVAMMLPSSLAFLRAAQRLGGMAAGAWAGVAYVAVWLAVGGGMWVALWLSGGLLLRLPPGGVETLAGISLLGAAIYQVSPLARSCQRACARPFGILARHWTGTSRHADAWTAGVHYGLSCVGCCVAMIALMFVVGMNDVVWLLVLALLMAAQKHPAWGRGLNVTTALALGSGGVAILAGWWSPALLGLRALCGG